MSELTRVELLWIKKRIENWIRFGRIAEVHVIDQQRRIVSFAPGSIFAFVRWASNDFGTLVSRIDILRVVGPGERYSTVPCVRPGGESLLRLAELGKGREGLTGDRRCGGARDRPGGRRPGALAAHPQPAVCRRATAALHPQPSSGLAAQTDSLVMTTRLPTLLAMATAVTVVTSTMGAKPVPRFVWNASESVPIGLYTVHPAGRLAVTNLVVAMPPQPLLSRRAQLPADRRAADQAHPGAPEPVRVPQRTAHQRRWNRDGHSPRARSSWPRAAHVAGLSSHRRR